MATRGEAVRAQLQSVKNCASSIPPMNLDELIKSAKFISNRNVSDRVQKVLISFDENVGHLTLVYHLQLSPTEDDIEDCELTCAELIAEFPEIRTAETLCISGADCAASKIQREHIVFFRE